MTFTLKPLNKLMLCAFFAIISTLSFANVAKAQNNFGALPQIQRCIYDPVNHTYTPCNYLPQPAMIGCPVNSGNACYVPPSHITSCSDAPAWMITSRIVLCVEGSIQMAMFSFLSNFTPLYSATIFAIMAFSMVLFGIKVFAGLEDITKDSLLYFFKFGMVLGFSFMLGGFYNAPFAIMKYATSLVVGQWSPWGNFDNYLSRIFGAGNAGQLFNGLIGMAYAAAASGVTGVLAAILAMLSMITTIYFAFRAMMTYLSSVMLIAFLLVLTPMIVPLALFANTNRYVDKWVDYMIGAIIHPVLLFAFLYMFMGTINTMLDWFINGMGANDFAQFYRGNRSMFSWMMTADPSTVRMLESTLGETTGRTAMQSFMSPVMSQAVEANPISSFALDFGVNQVWMMQQLVFGFLAIFIVSYLMLSMINYLPEVADSITGVVTGLRLEGIPFVSEFRQAFSKLKGGGT